MIRAYSQRLLPPYSGFVQIAETTHTRAQSFDGADWEIHHWSGSLQANGQQGRRQGYGLDRSYYRVASIQDKQLKQFILPNCLDAAEVAEGIQELSEFLSTASLPFPAADVFEYWLLDGRDESPLALIFSCCEESQIDGFPSHVEWTALPHSKMKIENTASEAAGNEPPVNHRFQRLIADRAGSRPRGAWFNRRETESAAFPSCLVREDWEEEADHDLCQRYIRRKAPRLLMLHGLPPADRERLEIAAKKHAIEVDQYFPLYPEINDRGLMSALRVEARLRRITPSDSRADNETPSSGVKPMSKDMRIIEN